MKKSVVWSTAGIILIWLTGCAQPMRYTPLTQEGLGNTAAVKIYGHVAQDKLAVPVEASNVSGYTGGGLIFGAIDAAITAKRAAKMEETVKPLYEQLSDFDFRKTFESALQDSPVKMALPDAKVGGVLATFTTEERKRLFEQTAENAILQVEMAYRLTPDCKRLLVGTTAYLWVRGKDTPVFFNNYGYHTPPVSASSDIAEAVKAWSNNRAEKLRVKLAEGISESMKMLNRDLSRKNDVVIASTTPPLWVIPFATKMTNPSYLEKNGNRYIMRAPNGTLVSLSSDDTL